MKFGILILAPAALIPAEAFATTPYLNGPYVVASSTFCPAAMENNDGVWSLTSVGEIIQLIGTITLTPKSTGAEAGSYSLTGLRNRAAVVVVANMTPGPFVTSAFSGSGVYALSGSKFTLTATGKSVRAYFATPGLPNAAGVLMQMSVQTLDANGCSNQLTFTLK